MVASGDEVLPRTATLINLDPAYHFSRGVSRLPRSVLPILARVGWPQETAVGSATTAASPIPRAHFLRYSHQVTFATIALKSCSAIGAFTALSTSVVRSERAWDCLRFASNRPRRLDWQPRRSFYARQLQDRSRNAPSVCKTDASVARLRARAVVNSQCTTDGTTEIHGRSSLRVGQG